MRPRKRCWEVEQKVGQTIVSRGAMAAARTRVRQNVQSLPRDCIVAVFADREMTFYVVYTNDVKFCFAAVQVKKGGNVDTRIIDILCVLLRASSKRSTMSLPQ